MSMIETVNDVKNSFLARREITCTFAGVGGKLKKLDAIDMVKKEFKLDGKIIIPISMKNHTGRPSITGTFYVYDDENLAKKQINPVIFKRLEKAKTAAEKPAEVKEEVVQDKPVEEKKESKPAEVKEEVVQDKPVEEKKESKPAEEKS
jgi:ribosomal protein S24E